MDSLKAQGRWEWYLRVQADARDRGFDAPVERATESITRMAASATPFDHHIPCILVDFSDNPAPGGKIASTPAMFDSLLFSTGKKNPTGSMTEYYSEISYGQMNVIGTVVGWFRMPNTYAYYVNNLMGMGSSPHNAARLAEAAIDSAAPYLDFSQFDNDDNGWVDGVMIVFPGPGYEETGDSSMIQSHRYRASDTRSYDGVSVADYTIQPEETNHPGGLNAVGVFCH
ncbi:MAG: immune inhibitor A domain-containing protein, partial [Candidatus Eisenbacteria bacterium]